MRLGPGDHQVAADDGTSLALHVRGGAVRDGAEVVGGDPPLLCLPGGPMLAADYLGTLGGLDTERTLVLLDPRGTGSSGRPEDPASYRCDRQVDDVETVRRHVGADRIDLLGHSAGANLAYRYLERHADRVRRLVLVTPSVRALDVAVSDGARSRVARSRADEPWYAEAAAALARIQAGAEESADWATIAPFTYGRWDDVVRDYHDRMEAQRVPGLPEAFAAEGAFDPSVTRAAAARLGSPVLVVAGGRDVGNPPEVMAEVAALFPHAELVVLPTAGHFPWLDDPAGLLGAVGAFLGRP